MCIDAEDENLDLIDMLSPKQTITLRFYSISQKWNYEVSSSLTEYSQ